MKPVKYPKYKESEVDLFGEVPDHWAVKRIKFCSIIRYGIGEPPKYVFEGVPLIRATNVNAGKIESSNLVQVDPNDIPSGRILWLKAGDIIVVRSGAYTGDSSIIPKEYEGAIAGFDMVLSAIGVNSNFIAYALLSQYIKDGQIYLEKLRAAQPHLNAEELGNCIVFIPPIQEQTQIANFLDYKTSQIDLLIKKKKELIEKLNERRIAVITQAVTKGLPSTGSGQVNPKVKMKDSEVEWLGEVPEHWDVLPLRRVVKSVKTGGTPAGVENSAFDDNGLNWYSPADFSESLILDVAGRKLSDDGKMEVKLFPPMTVMFVGIGATIGKIGISCNECSCNQQINGITCDKQLNPFFLAYYLKTMKDFIVKCGKYTTLPIINQEETKNLVVTLPPLVEQNKIIVCLDQEISKIDSLVIKVESAVTKLQEYRTSLITSAVTGKIDVRNFKIPVHSEASNG